jgi:hypothetical protein
MNKISYKNVTDIDMYIDKIRRLKVYVKAQFLHLFLPPIVFFSVNNGTSWLIESLQEMFGSSSLTAVDQLVMSQRLPVLETAHLYSDGLQK